MESANGDTALGNKVNRVPLPQLYLASQSKTSHQSNRISLCLEVGHFHCIFDFSFNLTKDTYVWLKVILSCLFSYSRRAFKHAIFDIESVVPTIDRTFPESPTPSPHGQPDPSTPGQMYLNTSTPQATTPSFITPLSNTSEPHNTSFDTSPLSSSPALIVPVNSTELYTYNDTSTLPGLLNSAKDDNSVIITSLVTSFVSNETLGSNGSLTGTPGNDILPPNRGLSRNNIVLITSLSIVIGCFAFTALLLRIGSRVMKAKKEAEERRRRRRHAVRRNQGKRSPQITIKQIRVRIEPDKRRKRNIKGSMKQIRAEPNRASLRRRQETEAETSFITLHDTSTRRTDGALVGIAACSTDVALGKGMVSTLKGESFTSETELLDAFEMDRQKRTHRDNEYDNPIMDVKDPDEEHRNARRTSTETETPFTSDTSNFPSWNNSPLHFISGRTTRRQSSPERTSLPSNTGERIDVARESSESGSNGDVHRRIKLMRMHGRRNSGNNSKDSGYAGGSFASQDSSRNLLAYLREDQLKREKSNADVTKEPESTRDATPIILEMENETAPLARLSRTHSTNLQPSRRRSLQVPRQTSYYHNNVARTSSHPYFPHQVRPVITGRRPLNDYYSREPLGHNRYNQHPYIVDCPPLYYEDSYFNFNEQSQQPATISYRRNNNPMFRLPPQEAQQYSPNLFPSLSSFLTSPPPLHQELHDDRTRFVKRKTASTQTPTDNSPETPPASPPSSPSIIRWYREGRSYVLMPRDDMDLDYLGPVYLAESMSESEQSLSEPAEISMASDVQKDLRQEQPRGKSDIDSETESDRTGTSDSAEGDEDTRVSSKDEDSVKDESALLLDDSSKVYIHDTKL